MEYNTKGTSGLNIRLVIIKDYGDAFDDLGKGNNFNCQMFLTCLLNLKKRNINVQSNFDI